MSRDEFVATFGDVYEHSPWVAADAFASGLDTGADCAAGLAVLMAAAVARAAESRQLALLRAHPDLAGKLARAGEITGDSQSEQAGAGLDRCSAEELARFHTLNQAYVGKFGFPYIIAVRGLDRQQILADFENRVANPRPAEFREALRQVNRIACLRLRERLPRPGRPVGG